MEQYTFAVTVFLLDYILHTQAGLFDTFLKPNQGLDPLKDLNPLYQMNKAKGDIEEALIDNRKHSYENNRDFWQNSQSKTDLRGFSDSEMTTRKTNRGLDPLREFNPLYQINKAKGAAKEALIDNPENKRQNGRGIWSTSQTKPSFYYTETTTPVDEKVAQLFPQGVDLLNKLQELNKLKEEGRLPLTNKPTKPTYRPDDSNKNEEVNILKPTKVKEAKVLKPLTKKKFYYQVQPVIPDNERRDVEETIYYIDL